MNIPLYAFTAGENTNISPLIHPKNNPVIINGCNNVWKIGVFTKDTGYEAKGSQIHAGKSILGMYSFIQNPLTQKMLVTLNDATDANTELWYWTGAAWNQVPATAAWNTYPNQRVEMTGFIGYNFFVGADLSGNYLPPASFTGLSFSTTTNVTGMPQGKYVVKYRDRLYVLHCKYGGVEYPFRVVASSVPVAGAITWNTAGAPTSSTGGFLDVDMSYYITGGSVNWDRLVVFTEYSAWIYDQSSWKEAWATGCSSHRTIKNSGAYMIWANYDGVWLSTGGQPQNISGEVIDFIKAADPRSMFAEIVDEEYYLYLGDVTVDGVTYQNCTKIFNIPTSAWRTREWYDTMTVYARYNDNGKMRLWMGNNSGEVFNKGKYTDTIILSSDAGYPISSNFELPPLLMSDVATNKKFTDMWAYADRGQGLRLQARILDRSKRILTPYFPIGTMDKFVNAFQIEAKKGALLQITGSEYSSNPYWSFFGIEVDIQPEGEILKTK